MRQMRIFLMWFWLQNKRLFRKKSFLLILFMMPCLVLGFRMLSGDERTILKIALYADEHDDAGQQVLKELTGDDSIIGFVAAKTKEEAEQLFFQGKTDAAWIFEHSLDERLQEAAREQDAGDLVRVLQREDSMQMRLARVKLYTAIYPHFVYVVYEEFIRNRLGGAQDCSAEELRAYYESNLVEHNIFQLRYMDVEEKMEDAGDYLMAPIRGMLALWLVLLGLASAMYYLQDEKAGLFDRIPVRHRYLLSVGYHFVAVADGAAVMLLAQFLTGNAVAPGRELISMLLFVWMIVGLCCFLQNACGKVERLGSLIPVLMLVMLVLCPVFMNVRKFYAAQCLLPPYHYLRSMHSERTLTDMIVYAVAVSVAGFVAFCMRTRK